MDIINLIDRSNKMFELASYMENLKNYDELVSLKTSLNNLLQSLDCNEPNFFEVLLLSSPVLFDFAFNSNLDDEGQKLRRSFEGRKNYEQAKKWYKFVRNSLIHTNRYTYNNFLGSIYRIEYRSGAIIYFELSTTKAYRFEEFKQNQFFLLNDKWNIDAGFSTTYEANQNVRLQVNFQYFEQFILSEINEFIRSVEHEIDNMLNNAVNIWNNYYKLYKQLIVGVCKDDVIDIGLLQKMKKSLVKLGGFDLEEAYVLCEFLVYLLNLDIELSPQMVQDITNITTFDKFYQLDERQIILNQIREIKEYQRVYINFQQVSWILNKLYPLTPQIEEQLQTLDHTNYLIMYVQKYLATKGSIVNE